MRKPKSPPKVIKKMVSFPPQLHEYAQQQATVIATAQGRRPNFSAFLASLIFQHRFSSSQH